MKVKLNTERVLSVSAIVVSIATVIALIYQSNLVRKQNEMNLKEQYASVMPYLTMGFTGDVDDKSFELTLKNEGLGPAFIEDIKINYRDSLYNMSIFKFYQNVLKVNNENNIRILRTDIGKNTVLPAGKTISLLLFFTNQSEGFRLLDAFATLEAKIEITYSSIYGQKWKMKSIDDIHIPVE